MRLWQAITFASWILPSLALSDDLFTTPSFWRKPNVTTSLEERIADANAAIEKVFSVLENESSGPLEFYGELIDLDAYTNKTTYKDQVLTFFELNVPDLSFQLSHGFFAIQAYNTYQSQKLLERATDIWDFGRTFTLLAGQTSMDVKSFELSTSCNGASMAGGTFWQTVADNTLLADFTTALFFILSAALSEVSANPKYLSAAIESGNFLLSNFLILEANNGKATISANASESCSTDNFGDGDFRVNSVGMFMKGLSIIPSETLIGSSKIEDLRQEAVFNTITLNSKLDTTDGIIDVGNGKGNKLVVEGLGALYREIQGNATNSALSSFIEDFLGVQYNAVVDRATLDGVVYGGSWAGPPSQIFDISNQTLALSVLVDVVLLPDLTTPNTSTNGTFSEGDIEDPIRKSISPGAIAGIVIGVLALLVAIGTAVLYFFRRRRVSPPSDDFGGITNAYMPPPPPPMIQADFAPQFTNVYVPPMIHADSAPQFNALPPLPPPLRRPPRGPPPPVPALVTVAPSHNPPPRRYLDEKRRPMPSFATTSESGQPQTRSSMNGASVASDPSAPDIETADLVRILAERFQQGQGGISMAPPAYDDYRERV